MRIDKYLKNARVIKRRTIAKEACEQGRVFVNGKEAKPGTEISVGDEIEIVFGTKPMKIKVEKLTEHVMKDDAKEMYTILWYFLFRIQYCGVYFIWVLKLISKSCLDINSFL